LTADSRVEHFFFMELSSDSLAPLPEKKPSMGALRKEGGTSERANNCDECCRAKESNNFFYDICGCYLKLKFGQIFCLGTSEKMTRLGPLPLLSYPF